MELCTSRIISNLPQQRLFSPSPSPVRSTASLPSKKTTISYRKSGTSPRGGSMLLKLLGLLHFSSPLLRATTSEEISTSIDEKSGEAPDGVITMEETPANGASGPHEAMPSEATKETPTGEQMEIFEFLDKINTKLDSEDAYPLLLYGSGSLAVLWLASALVSAVDSIPLFPKLLEIVGLAYTIWFSSRYLIFKKNRDELFAKIEKLKQEILGSTEV